MIICEHVSKRSLVLNSFKNLGKYFILPESVYIFLVIITYFFLCMVQRKEYIYNFENILER